MPDPAPIPRNIVLIGFMGCGKTTVGRELQQLLGYPFVDTDQLVESAAGKSIPAIFADEGEAAFRELESAVLRELAATPTPDRIIATGGGIVIRPANRPLLRSLGFVAWLRAPVDSILQRTARNRERPLLQTDDPRGRVESLLAERTPFYQECCHLEIDTRGLSSGEVACGILESARYHFTRP